MTFNAYKFDLNNFNNKIITSSTKFNNMKASSMKIQTEHDYFKTFYLKNYNQDLTMFQVKQDIEVFKNNNKF